PDLPLVVSRPALREARYGRPHRRVESQHNPDRQEWSRRRRATDLQADARRPGAPRPLTLTDDGCLAERLLRVLGRRLQSTTRPVSYAHIAIYTRLRAPILVNRLATWVLAVVRPMKRSAAISAFVRPRATSASTSSSRSVRGSFGWLRRVDGSLAAGVDSRRRVMFGAIRASPAAAACTAWTSSSGPAS